MCSATGSVALGSAAAAEQGDHLTVDVFQGQGYLLVGKSAHPVEHGLPMRARWLGSPRSENPRADVVATGHQSVSFESHAKVSECRSDPRTQVDLSCLPSLRLRDAAHV